MGQDRWWMKTDGKQQLAMTGGDVIYYLEYHSDAWHDGRQYMKSIKNITERGEHS